MAITIAGWVGSVVIVLGLHFLARQSRFGFLGTGFGSLVWCAIGVLGHTWSLVALNLAAAYMSYEGWNQWKKQNDSRTLTLDSLCMGDNDD